MDIRKQLIIIKGKDKTADIRQLTSAGSKYIIIFNSFPKEYRYSKANVQIFTLQAEISPKEYTAVVKGRRYPAFDSILDFGPWYKIIVRGKAKLFPREQVKLIENCLADRVCRSRFEYFKSIAGAISLKTDEGVNILYDQYSRIDFLSRNTAAGDFLSDNHHPAALPSPELLIYPFGINQSQKKAVENAFSSQISIIQGPPGTGKTQTILNIIANAVIYNKTVAVVSNNNSATRNVADKLRNNKLGFITAFLGNRENKDEFIENQTGIYPPMEDWCIDARELERLKEHIRRLTEELGSRLSARNRIADIDKELMELRPERSCFEEYYRGCRKLPCEPELDFSSVKILRLLNEAEALAESGRSPGFFMKIRIFFSYGSAAVKLLSEAPEAVCAYLQRLFYIRKESELNTERAELSSGLENYAFSEKLQQLSDDSMRLFRHCIARKYGLRQQRPIFEYGDLKRRSDAFNHEYPVILSTTYSIRNSLNRKHIYDYLIVDEASQVDLATGVLALSCSKNAVIVGDLNQLPNVIGSNDEAAADSFWQSSFGEKYRFTTHSLLSAACEVWEDAPSVLLREHYRCHPKIINFCNQKFYGGRLIPMTEDHGEDDVLALYRCPEGSHARGRRNQRQADIIENEVLPALASSGYEDIGVIAPYNAQVRLLRSQLPSSLEIDTVHKFQGREKQAIVLSSVDNEITDFVDDYHMLNVAVSRAVRSLTVVTSHSCGSGCSNYDDLARYISYNNFQAVDSRTYSVFDLLYKENRKERLRFLRRHGRISEYDSENLLYSVIEDILSEPHFCSIGCAVHVPLSMIIRDCSSLSEAERKFVECPMSHTDFLLFSRMDKSPVLAVEVDGAAFHAAGSVQSIRDEKKNRIFALSGISLLRLRTDSSGEKEKIRSALEKALLHRGT